jgi:lipopolysaccharide export system protein LptA
MNDIRFHCKLKDQMKRLQVLFAALIIPAGRPDIEIKNFNLVESHLATRSMELQAGSAQLFQEERIGLLHKILAKIWSHQGSIYEIQAQVAAIDTLKQSFRTEGVTTISTPDSYRLETSDVSYDAETKTLRGSQDVRLAPLTGAQMQGAQNFKLQGRGLFVDLSRDLFRIEKSVRSEQKIDPKITLKITSKSFEFDSSAERARFVNDVTVTHPKYSMKGKILDLLFAQLPSPPSKKDPDLESSAPKMLREMFLQASTDPKSSAKVQAAVDTTTFLSKGFRILFGPDGTPSGSEAIGAAEAKLDNGIVLRAEKLYSFIEDDVQKIRMEENVEIITPTRRAQCQQALFTPSTGDFVLEKIASLSDEEQTIRGERIYFSTKNSTLRVEKASGKINREKVQISTSPKD